MQLLYKWHYVVFKLALLSLLVSANQCAEHALAAVCGGLVWRTSGHWHAHTSRSGNDTGNDADNDAGIPNSIPAFAEDALRGSELFRCSKSESIVYLRYAAEAPVGRTSRQLVSQSVLLVLVLVVSVPIALFH